MSESNRLVTRRNALATTGATLSVAIAGCLEGLGGGGNGNGDEDENGNGNGDENETGGNGIGNGNGDENETGGNGNETGGGSVSDEWQDVEEIELGGETQAWVGVAPDVIADEENPTLELVEGNQYTITWENLDGASHNIELRDENDEVVDDYSTDTMSGEGETQSLEFEATSEMTQYVCQPHQTTMVGDVEVVADGGEGGNGGNETEGNGDNETAGDDNETDGDGENDTGGNGDNDTDL